MAEQHNWPDGDTREHEANGGDCWCEPTKVVYVAAGKEPVSIYCHRRSEGPRDG